MRQINEDVGFDHVASEQIHRIRFIWEPDKESIKDFFDDVCFRFPKQEKRILKGEIQIIIRKQVEKLDGLSSKKKNKSF